jgi:transcriptional regulator with XRE-family HTH domain
MPITNPLAGRQRVHKGRVDDIGFTNRRIVGDYIANKRMARGLTQRELGKALGMLDTSVSAIELGRNSLAPERYAEMADALGVGRKSYARLLLRYYNPWLFAMLYPDQLPEKALGDIPERIADHREEEDEAVP